MGNVFSPRLLGEWVMSISRVDPGMAVGDTMAPTITDKPPTPGWLCGEGVLGIYSTAQGH